MRFVRMLVRLLRIPLGNLESISRACKTIYFEAKAIVSLGTPGGIYLSGN